METVMNATKWNTTLSIFSWANRLKCEITVFIPVIHGIVIVVSIIMNVYMLHKIHCLSCKRTKTRGVDYFFSQLGVCNIAMVMTVPVWVTQSLSVHGWVFGYFVCKLVKCVTTVSKSSHYHKYI